LGISTQELETARKDALKQTFPFNYQVCRGKVEEILKIMRAYIYARDEAKKMIAIYVSESDTTPVGIFFTEIDSSHTQVEVSSHSTFAREFISEDLFTGLEKGLESVRRPAESNEPPPQFMKD
jgi:hypothetical protein